MSAPSPTRPRIWAIGISRLLDAFAELLPSYTDRADIRIIEKGFEAAAVAVEEGVREGRVDAVVSGGANGTYLRQHVNAPVLLVKVTGFDVLSALATARRVSAKIALVTHASTYAEMDDFCRAFGIDIPAYTYLTAYDASKLVLSLKADGIAVVVGPGLVTDLAEKAGMTGVFLYSGHSVRSAIDAAIEATQLHQAEATRRQYVNAVISHLNEGVVAVDAAGYVQAFNPAMERFLGVAQTDALGQRWQHISPALPLDAVMQTGTQELEAIHRLGDKTVVVNRIPLVQLGASTGAVLTMQDATAIQRVGRNLRSRSRARPTGVRYTLENLRGTSAAMRSVRELARRYAAVDSTVLIHGESGTGKEVIAQGMHHASPRHAFPFVAVNCAAFPEALLESELFGYAEGAFSGASRGGKIGLFEAAHDGTLFLDEIGDMSPALQVRLLRVLQERQVLPLGSLDPVPVNVRIIAATHRNLQERVTEGSFREDLFFRLNILRIDVAPLRERMEDVIVIAQELYQRIALRLQLTPNEGLPRPLETYLLRHEWPGNIRELENVLERVAVLMGGRTLTDKDWQEELRVAVPEFFTRQAPTSITPVPAPLADMARSTGIAHIRQVLEECGGNRAEACRILGISATTLWRRLREKS